jgi:putative protein-disulfide isomerase
MRQFIVFFICIISFNEIVFSQNTMTQKPKLYYVYDPLCGWCYGFSPVMVDIEKKYAGKLDIEVISGGMIRGSRVGPIGKVAPFIKDAYKTVEQHCGVKFGNGFLKGVLEPGTMIFSSEMPCRALVCVKQINPELAVTFAHDLQKGIYYDGIDTGDLNAYAPLLAKHKILVSRFNELMQNDETLKATKAEYALAETLGVTGFPTLILEKDGKKTVLARGYSSFDQLDSKLKKLL